MMRIRKGDKVKIIAGKDKGKSGKVIQSFPKTRAIVVEGVNVLTKHLRIRKEGEKGRKIEFASPITVSNAMLVCPKCAKPTRVGVKLLSGDSKKKARLCKQCEEVIE